LLRGSGELEGEGDAVGDAGSDAEGETQYCAVGDAEDQSIGDAAGEGAEGSVFASEDVVGEVEGAEDIEEAADKTDGC
jgi:hypothetical protein